MNFFKDQAKGVDIIRNALKMPALTIANNAGKNGSVIVDKLLSHPAFEFGYDAQNDIFVDSFESGIVDPTRVRNLSEKQIIIRVHSFTSLLIFLSVQTLKIFNKQNSNGLVYDC